MCGCQKMKANEDFVGKKEVNEDFVGKKEELNVWVLGIDSK